MRVRLLFQWNSNVSQLLTHTNTVTWVYFRRKKKDVSMEKENKKAGKYEMYESKAITLI